MSWMRGGDWLTIDGSGWDLSIEGIDTMTEPDLSIGSDRCKAMVDGWMTVVEEAIGHDLAFICRAVYVHDAMLKALEAVVAAQAGGPIEGWAALELVQEAIVKAKAEANTRGVY